jgi:putative Mg2+ transporter-C (MgtC) family protein
MGDWWQGVDRDFSDLASANEAVRVAVRLLLAAVLGGVLGWERERLGKAAGLRTHMLVALGAALFVLVPQQAGFSSSDLSRVIQGLVAGIGFLGAGAILKLSEEHRIQGLTTAAGIWVTAAVGMTAGLGRGATAVLATVLGFLILDVLCRYERRLAGKAKAAARDGGPTSGRESPEPPPTS